MSIGIPYEDNDYREDNLDDERNDLRDMRDMRPENNNNDGPPNHNQNPYDLNRPSYFDAGARYPYNNPAFNRGPPFGIYNQYNPAQQPAPLYPQPQQLQQPHLPVQQPQSAAAQSLDGGRGGNQNNNNNNNQNGGFSPYAQNPYGWNRPGYGWPRPASSGWSLGFPFNLFGLGSYRPSWPAWGRNNWGLFF